ncbi:hypothetical protein [Krasilnikovia sp. MM14-A1259]|uniref:hypothetical protein n=1 Tax=Krasilnikovia sp. MM14-A1259 TaxID=3373539 RepID=UPI00399CAB5A
MTLAPVLLAPPAAAAAGPPAAAAQVQAEVSVHPDTIHPGGHVVITGVVPAGGPQSCPAGNAAVPTSTAALFPPDGFGPEAPRNHSGHFSIAYVVPASTPPGTYVIGVRCGGGNVGISADLRVV